MSAKHFVCVTPLGENEVYVSEGKFVSRSTFIEEITGFIKQGMANVTNCSACGGILPGLMFEYEGKEYYFTCYKITDRNGKVIAKTNYEQLGKWRQGRKKVLSHE